MRKSFIDNLPRKNGKLKKIDWRKSVGCVIEFIYDEIRGNIEIIEVYKNQGTYVKIKYNSNIFSIYTGNLIKGAIGNIVGVNTSTYKYKIGENVDHVRSGNIMIIDQIRMKNGNQTQKGYNYRCLICSNEDQISEYHLTEGNGCNVCSTPSKKTLVGFNDIATTHPIHHKMMWDCEDGYKYSLGSSQFIYWKCLTCGEKLKKKKICEVINDGLSCPKCSDGLSYPEKVMRNTLIGIGVDFEYDKTFEWSNNKRYDFFVPSLSLIIETHGEQHYGRRGQFKQKTLEEEKLNDKFKREMASKYISNYIELDCRESNLDYIKNSIINSKLSNIFSNIGKTLNTIDWFKIEENSIKSLVKDVCGMFENDEKLTTGEIGNILSLDKTTVSKYLKIGTKLGWCNYDPEKEKIKNALNMAKQNNKKIVQLSMYDELLRTFDSMKEASYLLKINQSNISMTCNGKRNHAGGFKWMYKEDYEKLIISSVS